jgi:hypothetical protein
MMKEASGFEDALPSGLDRIDTAQPQERHQSQRHSLQGLHGVFSSLMVPIQI